MVTATTAAAPTRDLTAEVAFLTRALKPPTLRDCVQRLAERARDEGWSQRTSSVSGSQGPSSSGAV